MVGARDEHLADELVKTLAGLGIHATKTAANTQGTYGPSSVFRVRARSLWLVAALEALGMGRLSGGKRLPDVAADLVPHLLGGWLDGDGNADGLVVTGYSRSKEMIRDAWRLAAKAGVPGSITHDGEQLNFSGSEMATAVGGWTTRLRPRAPKRHRPPNSWWPAAGGWMFRVDRVEFRAGEIEVSAIETASGTYLADGILTHNCLPAQEAAAAGLALLMSDCSPNAEYPGYLMASAKSGVETMPVGSVHSWRVPPSTIGRTINHFASRRDALAKMQERSLEWAEKRTWAKVGPLWIEGLKKLCE